MKAFVVKQFWCHIVRGTFLALYKKINWTNNNARAHTLRSGVLWAMGWANNRPFSPFRYPWEWLEPTRNHKVLTFQIHWLIYLTVSNRHKYNPLNGHVWDKSENAIKFDEQKERRKRTAGRQWYLWQKQQQMVRAAFCPNESKTNTHSIPYERRRIGATFRSLTQSVSLSTYLFKQSEKVCSRAILDDEPNVVGCFVPINEF